MSNNTPSINLGDTTFDKVWSYFKKPGKVSLSPKQEEKKNRWLTLFTLRINFHSRLQAINAYIEQQKLAGVEISQSQAYKDMSLAMKLFGDVHKADRQASLIVLQEYAHKTFLLAYKQKNPLAMSAALSKLEKYMEIDRVDSINYNPAKLEDKPDKFSLPKDIQEVVFKHLTKGVVDFNKLPMEDVEYKEVTTDEEV